MAEEASEQSPGLIAPDEMQVAIETSGYLLEGRIGRVLRERGFYVETNAFHMDPNDAEKKLEVDVLGRYFEWINEASKDAAYASIFVECKNNSQPVAFFVNEQQVTELNANRILYGGYPSFSMDPATHVQERLSGLLRMSEWHHYCATQEIATQFCSFIRQGKKWKATAMDHYSKSIADIALVAAADCDGSFNLDVQSIQVQLTYPIVVFQGPIYCVRDKSGKATLEEVEHIQLHHSAMLRGSMLQVQIDVVTESAFPKVLEKILSELATFRDRINSLYPRLLN